MKKTITIFISIFSSFAIVCLIIYIFLCAVNRNIPQDLVYPKSGLSESIFDSQEQNMKYVANENLTKTHSFLRCPYTFDTLDTDFAKVGEYGTVYRISDSMYIYATEVARGTSVETLMKQELSKAVMVDANTELSIIDNIVYDEGYINGFKGDYYIDRLTVSNSTRSASVYLTGFLLTLTDEDSMHGYDMFLGIVSAKAETDVFTLAKEMLDQLVGTIQYSSTIQRALLEEEEKLKKENAQNTTDTTIATTGASNSDLASQADLAKPDAVLPDTSFYKDGADAIPKQKDKSITLTEAYTNVTLYYYFTNTQDVPTLTLYNPDKTVSYQPESIADGKAIFKLSEMESGKWHLTVIGDPGEESLRLYSETMEVNE